MATNTPQAVNQMTGGQAPPTNTGPAASQAPGLTPAVGYIRVSTHKQKHLGNSLQAQKLILQSYCKMWGLDMIECVEEPGVSAGKKIHQRPGLLRVLELVDQRQVQAVVVQKIDRMFRSIRDAGDVLELLKKRKVGFHAVEQRFDTSTVYGEAMLEVLLVFAKMERGMAGERTRSVLRSTKTADKAWRLKSSGKNAAVRHRAHTNKLMVGRAPYGYCWVSKELVPEAGEQKVLRRMRVLRRTKGWGARKIAQDLNTRGVMARGGAPWDHSQVRRILGRGYR